MQATPISDMLDLATAPGRLQALLCSCNISRLLAGYASQAPLVPLEMGRLVSSDDGMRTYCLLPGRYIYGSMRRDWGLMECFTVRFMHGSAAMHVWEERKLASRRAVYVPRPQHTGCFRKVIREFASEHAQYGSFELLQCVYRQMAQKKHRSKIIQACDIDGHIGPRLLDNTYTVHLAPVGDPCSGPPADPLDLPCAVAGVLGGLAALHSEGTITVPVIGVKVDFVLEPLYHHAHATHAGNPKS